MYNIIFNILYIYDIFIIVSTSISIIAVAVFVTPHLFSLLLSPYLCWCFSCHIGVRLIVAAIVVNLVALSLLLHHCFVLFNTYQVSSCFQCYHCYFCVIVISIVLLLLLFFFFFVVANIFYYYNYCGMSVIVIIGFRGVVAIIIIIGFIKLLLLIFHIALSFFMFF